MTFLPAKLTSGYQLVSAMSHLKQITQEADLVITGERKIDFQTSMGKVASGVLSFVKVIHVLIIAIYGVAVIPICAIFMHITHL